MKKSFFIFLILLLIIITSCQSKQQTTTESTTLPTTEVNDITSTTTTPSQKVVEFQITAKQFEFIPSTITVNKGDRVRLIVKSIDVNHGFALPDFGISQPINAGQTAIVEFTADKTGTFSFFCNVFCGQGHKDMKGTLIVK